MPRRVNCHVGGSSGGSGLARLVFLNRMQVAVDGQQRIAIVVSTYNASVTERMLRGAVGTLEKAGFGSDRVTILRVPGAWELALGATWAAADHAAVIALGAVIRGETTHDEHINRTVSQILGDLAVRTGKPVGFGLLTCLTMEQAIQRAGGNVGNKGEEAAEAVLAMLDLRRTLPSGVQTNAFS